MEILPKFGKFGLRNPLNLRHVIEDIRRGYCKRWDKLVSAPTPISDSKIKRRYEKVIRQCDSALQKLNDNPKKYPMGKNSLLFQQIKARKKMPTASYKRMEKLQVGHMSIPVRKSVMDEIDLLGLGNRTLGLIQFSAIHKRKPLEELRKHIYP